MSSSDHEPGCRVDIDGVKLVRPLVSIAGLTTTTAQVAKFPLMTVCFGEGVRRGIWRMKACVMTASGIIIIIIIIIDSVVVLKIGISVVSVVGRCIEKGGRSQFGLADDNAAFSNFRDAEDCVFVDSCKVELPRALWIDLDGDHMTQIVGKDSFQEYSEMMNFMFVDRDNQNSIGFQEVLNPDYS